MSIESIDELAKTIWDYHHMHHQLAKSDLIWVLGSNDLRVADYAADLFLQKWAPIILFSGGVAHKNDILATSWGDLTEAEKFSEVAIQKSIPKDKILLENNSTNTGENIQFSYQLMQDHNLHPKKVILVQKPFMERRTYATFMKQWPGEPIQIIVTSPPISFEDFPNQQISRDDLINTMVGDLQRIKVYPEKGFQIPQDIPTDVWRAYEQLVVLGYTKHLIK